MGVPIAKLNTDTIPGVSDDGTAILTQTAEVEFNDGTNWWAAKSFEEQAVA